MHADSRKILIYNIAQIKHVLWHSKYIFVCLEVWDQSSLSMSLPHNCLQSVVEKGTHMILLAKVKYLYFHMNGKNRFYDLSLPVILG